MACYPPPLPVGRETVRGEAPGVSQARRFLAAGADILDVGGESTRPGSQPVDAAEELRRVIPAIRAILAEIPEALISIDTYKAEVAGQALQAGAAIINDVWGIARRSGTGQGGCKPSGCSGADAQPFETCQR